MSTHFSQSANGRVLKLVTIDQRDEAVTALSPDNQVLAANFKAGAGQVVLLPGGGDCAALYGMGAGKDAFAMGSAAMSLPEGDWEIHDLPDSVDPTLASVAWALGGYKFSRFKSTDREPARLILPAAADDAEAQAIVDAVFLTRDLINSPADVMGPAGLEAEFRKLAETHAAKVKVTTGQALLDDNYPMIHAVGRAAHEEPRLLELEWGNPDHPRIAVVGKGVTFDSGGLDIKAAQYMRLMKKDMGGGANAMGLASMIMAAKLPVYLHLLVPAVENAISAGAMRPGDILPSRKGLTVEVDNTDAEGRLVLADALARATEEDCEMVLDFATLTGAARVALGAELAPFYTDNDALAAQFTASGTEVSDPLWRMPLWDGYDKEIEGGISDLVNAAAIPMAGSITAALFLRRFVGDANWTHFDIFGWNPKDRPGRQKGGEMLAVRAVYQTLKNRFVH
ncbi:MAG: leucyl aminopeptidase family protein [Maricaulis sp.]|jgi:leucyl aminopeptidase|nr:leucyl aminopeptidase family protein [Maricaulis sp.]MDG2043902.1 leucyl aminopeptidase family protein [Maricaulis sp.]